ncbi:MAG: hypothetical protein COT74_03795 [Bdellovibrionales bacterium CG10_big_fil_rev_8_21_14_0_10_45_34]|nr:MAG: hypothetical protein COT74_03795 [Bdellovibrionales bacterium CG10_big_fil_rev_8_21_14_0_10_45_34]
MNTVLQLMKDRNDLLGKFHCMNEIEIEKIKNRDFQTIEPFYSGRQTLLEMIDRVEKKLVNEIQFTLSGHDLDFTTRQLVGDFLEERDHLVTEILDQDLQILGFIEEEKSRIIRDLKEVVEKKAKVGKFQSGMKKYKFDEEA